MNNLIKINWKYYLLSLCMLPLTVNSQTVTTKIPPELTDGIQIETQSAYYNQAFLEISDMLDGKTPLSIKRAVFLAEWAYMDGKTCYDYKRYCAIIDSAADFIHRFVKANKLEKYKTGKNMALIDYFFKPYSGNNYKPFRYNFEDFDTDDFTTQFVTEVMQTHTGQCRSLPYYYKVLAEAVGAEAYIAYAPLHVLIRYRDEDDLFPEDWVNIELTSQQLVPEFGIIESFEITEKAIEGKIYLYPLTDRETVGSQLADLAFGYWKKYKIYDDFTWLCVNKALEYYPQNPKALTIKGHSLNRYYMRYLQQNGYIKDQYTMFLESKLLEILNEMDDLGWEEMSGELKGKLDNNVEKAKRLLETKKK